MNYIKGQLRDKLNKLPEDIQQELSSDDLGLIIQIIGSDVDITPEQSLDVEDEVVAVLMGTSHPKDFIRNIQTKIGVDEEKARAIAEKVNDEIFQLVKESLKVVHNIGDDQQPTTNNLQQAPLRSELGSTPTPPMVPKPPAPKSATITTFPQMIVPEGISVPEAPKPSQNIFEQKLQGVFKMPKEETLVPQKPSFSPTPPTPPRPSGVDPYREQPK